MANGFKYPFEATTPQIHKTAFIAEGAIVIGDVQIGAESSLWFNSVLRGDVFPIRVGERSNIQDLTVGHVTSGTHALIIGDDVTIGHRAVIHGCTIGDRVLIGMGAIIMDGAKIESDCMIAAGALVTPNTEVVSGSLVVGAPGKVKRELTAKERDFLPISAQNYVQLAKRHQQSR